MATSTAQDPRSSHASPRVNLYALHAQPAPIRTFPLPAFYPHNPVSLLHLAYVWLSQVLFPPAPEPSVVHEGVWDPATRSVHVRDPKSIRALWEQGFYGKGSLSRSEPNWLKREQARRGLRQGNQVSELRTAERRDERRVFKWTRAAEEQDAIESTKLREAQAARQISGLGPDGACLEENTAEALEREMTEASVKIVEKTRTVSETKVSMPKAPVGPTELLALPNSLADLVALTVLPNGHAVDADGTQSKSAPENGADSQANGTANGHAITAESETSPSSGEEPSKRRKSVRFSSTIESTTFRRGDPPSPNPVPAAPSLTKTPTAVVVRDQVCESRLATEVNGTNGTIKTHEVRRLSVTTTETVIEAVAPAETTAIADREKFYLTREEALFLSASLGAMRVVHPATNAPISTAELFALCRTYDPSLVRFVVTHHYRSLGWCPKEGVKFGVDFLLYKRGPALDHAEFGLMLVPSGSGSDQDDPRLAWARLMGIIRVMSHVFKALMLVYVTVPSREALDTALAREGVAGALRQYTIREVMVRRWSANRNR